MTAPGCNAAPALSVTSPGITPIDVLELPPPASIPPEFTVTEPVPIAEPVPFCRFNHPPLTVVPPV